MSAWNRFRKKEKTMERYTGKDRNGANVLELRANKSAWSVGRKGRDPMYRIYGAAVDRLSAYEDIGLTPEQLLEVDRLYTEKCKEVAELHKLADQLMTRCHALTGGTLCVNCPLECKRRIAEFLRGE